MEKPQINKQTSLAENNFSDNNLSNSSEEESLSENSEEEDESSSHRSLSNEHHQQNDQKPKTQYHKQKYHIQEERHNKCSTKNKRTSFKNSKRMENKGFRRSSLMRDFSYFAEQEEHQFQLIQNNSLLAWRKFQNTATPEPQKLQDPRSSRTPTYLRTTICLRTQNQNVFSLKNLQKAQGQKIEEDSPFLTQVRSALRRKSCTCKECGRFLDQKQVKTQDVPYVPMQHRKYTDIKRRISNILATPINSGLKNTGININILEPYQNVNQMSEITGQIPLSELRIPRSSNYLSESLSQYTSDLNKNDEHERRSPKKLTQTYNIPANNKITSFEGQSSQKLILFENNSNTLKVYSPVKGKVEKSFTDKINSTKQLGNILEKTSNKQNESQNYLKRVIKVNNPVSRNASKTSSHTQIEELIKHKMITEHTDKREDIAESNNLPLSLTSRASVLIVNTTNQKGHSASMESLIHFRDRYLKYFKEKKDTKNIPSKEWCNYDKSIKQNVETSPRKLKIDERSGGEQKVHLSNNNSNNQNEKNKQKKHHIKNKLSSISVLGRDKEDTPQQILEKIKVFSQNNSRLLPHPYMKDSTKSVKSGDFTTKDKQNNKPNSSFQKLLQPLGQKSNTGSTIHLQATKPNLISKKRRLLFPSQINNQQTLQTPNIVLQKIQNARDSNSTVFNNTISNDHDINTRSASSHKIASSLHSQDLTAESNTTIASAALLQLQPKGYYHGHPKGSQVGKHQRKNVSLVIFQNESK